MPAKRDPLLTARGTRYTYAGWTRAFNAALKNSGSNLAYRLGEEYPDHYNKYYAQLRKNDLGSRQHAPNPGNPPKPRQSKPRQSKPRQSKPKPNKRARDLQARIPHLIAETEQEIKGIQKQIEDSRLHNRPSDLAYWRKRLRAKREDLKNLKTHLA